MDRFDIETVRDCCIFIGILSVIAAFAALWLPVPWGAVEKMIAGFFSGIFWGFIAMTSRLLGAFKDL